MPIEGGRLNAHKQRIDDLRRRKSDQRAKNKSYRVKDNEKLDFDIVDPLELAKIKGAIQQKAKKRKRTEILLIVISMIIAIILLYLFTQKYE